MHALDGERASDNWMDYDGTYNYEYIGINTMAQISTRCFHMTPRVLLRKLKRTGPMTKWQMNPTPRRLDPKISSDPNYEDPSYFEKAAKKLKIGPDYIEQLDKLWHEKLSTDRDVFFKKDDRLTQHDSNYWLPQIDPMTPRLGYENVEALKNAPDSVKKIFSVGYGERKDLSELWKKQIIDSVKQSPIDNSSLESKIAKATALIRSWAKLTDDIASRTAKKPRWLISMLRLHIFRRRKYLKLLRNQDSEAFERVLKELKIAYYVPLEPEDIPQSSREGWILDQGSSLN